MDVIFLYVKAKLGWSFTSYATFFALKCGVDGVALLLLLPLLRRCLGLRNASLGVLGGLSRATYFIVLGSAYKPSMVFGGKLERCAHFCVFVAECVYACLFRRKKGLNVCNIYSPCFYFYSSGDCCLRTISVRKRPCYHVKSRRRK